VFRRRRRRLVQIKSSDDDGTRFKKKEESQNVLRRGGSQGRGRCQERKKGKGRGIKTPAASLLSKRKNPTS